MADIVADDDASMADIPVRRHTKLGGQPPWSATEADTAHVTVGSHLQLVVLVVTQHLHFAGL